MFIFNADSVAAIAATAATPVEEKDVDELQIFCSETVDEWLPFVCLGLELVKPLK